MGGRSAWRWQVLLKFDRNRDKLIDASEFAEAMKSDALELMGMPRANVQEAITEAIRTLQAIKRESSAVTVTAAAPVEERRQSAPSPRSPAKGAVDQGVMGMMRAGPLAIADRTMMAAKGAVAKGTAAAKGAVAAAEGAVVMGATTAKGLAVAAEGVVVESTGHLSAKVVATTVGASEVVKTGGLAVVHGTVELAKKGGDSTVQLAKKASRAVCGRLAQGNRRAAVVSESASRRKGWRWQEACDVVRPCEAKTAAQEATLRAALRANRAFRRLDDFLIEQIIEAMRTARAARGEMVIRQGDAGDSFYIVVEGTLEVVVGGACVKTIGPGDSFGELALLYSQPRNASIRCSSAAGARLYRLGRIAFRNLVTNAQQASADALEVQLARVPELRGLDRPERKKLVEAMSMRAFADGELILAEGAPADSLYFVLSGEVMCSTEGSTNKVRLASGSFFGESSIAHASPGAAPKRQATVVAAGKVCCAVLAASDCRSILGSLEVALQRSYLAKISESISLFADLSPEERQILLMHLELKRASAGTPTAAPACRPRCARPPRCLSAPMSAYAR